MATEAKVVITGENRLGATVRQAQRDLESIARSAERTGKLFNKLFTIGVGFGFTRVLSEVAQQTQKAGEGGAEFARKIDTVRASFDNLLAVKGGLPEVNANLDALAKTLQDPSIVAAADSFFSAILKGATAAAKGIAEISGGIRTIGVQAGLFTPNTQQEKVDAISGEVDRERKAADLARTRLTNLVPGSPDYERFSAELKSREARIRELNAKQQELFGPGKGDKPTDITPFLPKDADAKGGKAARAAEPKESKGRFVDTFDIPKGGLVPIDPGQLEATRFDQFGKELKSTLEDSARETSDRMKDIFAEPFDEMSVYAEQAARNMQDAFADFLFDPFKGGLQGMLASFEQTIRQMVAQAIAADLFKRLGNWAAGAAGSGGIAGAIGSVVKVMLPGKAAGGPVSGGSPYMVGEQGPELFVPRMSGSIIPNMALAAASSRSMTVVNNFSIAAPSGTIDRRTQMQLAAQVRRSVERGGRNA